MAVALSSMDNPSVHNIEQMLLCEQHSEVTVLPYLLKITKTDFGKSLGLPSTFWDGGYDKESKQTTIRIQDVIHKGAWKKHLLRPQPHNLPPGFTLIHFSLTTAGTDFTRFFLNHYSKRYKSLPHESKVILFNEARACALWESIEEKITLEERGFKGFACPWVYQRLIDGRKFYFEYPQEIIRINRAAKVYRMTNGMRGYSPEVAYDRRVRAYDMLNKQVTRLATLPPPIQLLPLPPGVPALKLLEEPPTEFLSTEEGV